MDSRISRCTRCSFRVVRFDMNRNRYVKYLPVLLSLGSLSGFAQSSASLLGASYAKPSPFLVAPGQIVTLFFRGVGPQANGSTRLDDARAIPLPETLAGLSLKISQSGAAAPLPVPIVSVRQETECDTASSECYLTAVRVQIPFELAASTTPRLGAGGVKAPDAELALIVDGKASRTFLLRPVSENGHVLTSCDLAGDTNPDSVSNHTAYHADGRPVNMDAPAALGETILIYAFGLGQTTPAARTAEASGTGLSVLDPLQPRLIVTLQDSLLNASPAVPRAVVAEPYNLPRAKIDFAGLAPGQIGVYQINIPIPTSFQVPVRCGPDASIGSIRSNGLLQLTTAQGTENVPICVAP